MKGRIVDRRTIIFSHRRAVGDGLMFTCGVRDFKLLFPDIDIVVNSNFPELWLNNPYTYDVINLSTAKVKPEKGVEYYQIGYPIINNANHANTHFTQGFLFDMIAMADSHKSLEMPLYRFVSAFANGRMGDPDIDNKKTNMFKSYKDGGLRFLPENLRSLYSENESFCQNFGRIRPDIHLSAEEKKTNLLKEKYDTDRYWVIAPGGKRDCTCKIWDWRRFQKVVDHFKGYIKFVVIGRSDHLVEKLTGVISLVDKFNKNLRGLFPIVYHADGCVSGISLLHHLCAAMPNKNNENAFPKPSVTIYGGREPVTFTAYNQTYPLHTNGAIDCCAYGGCWHSRVVPLEKDRDKNKRLCRSTVVRDSKTIQRCMDMITADDVIRTIERLYEGDVLKPLEASKKPIKRKGGEKSLKENEYFNFEEPKKKIEVSNSIVRKEINFLASMNTDGGGEQSAAYIVKLLRDANWNVHFYSWCEIHSRFSNEDIADPFTVVKNKVKDYGPMRDTMKVGIPLVFYGNDNVNEFIDNGAELVEKSESVIIGINYINGDLPKCGGELAKKLKAVIFQNEEKLMEFERDQIGMPNLEKIVLFGAIDLNKFVDILPESRKNNGKMVVLKHCKPDYRKYVTNESVGGGQKIHIWQKHFAKDIDIDFYGRLLKETKDIYFEFMAAHPEIVKAFPNEPRMKFWQWDQIPVEEFLARGHVYLYRTSNMWRDQYPRVVGEALAAGLPVLTEPRDGTKDRVIHGDTGFYCIDYDQFKLALATFKRKEEARRAMGMYAKDWARINLNPVKWVEVLDSLVD